MYLRDYLHDIPLKAVKFIADRIFAADAFELSPDLLNKLQEELLFAPKRAPEELYDIKADPYETVNLAGNPKYRRVLRSMRLRLKTWMKDTHDPGPESPEVYAAEMEYQIGKNRNNPKSHSAIKKNVTGY